MHVILTGPPGVGKTTLVQKVCKVLLERQVPLNGFYTEEERDPVSKKRIGFSIVTVDGKRGTLSNVNSTSTKRVGNYGVEVEEFENLALPALSVNLEKTSSPKVLVIDEIGKMEMFSQKFKDAVMKTFNTQGVTLLTTIPIAKGKPIEFVETIRRRSDIKLFVLDKSNRDNVETEIINTILGL